MYDNNTYSQSIHLYIIINIIIIMLNIKNIIPFLHPNKSTLAPSLAFLFSK